MAALPPVRRHRTVSRVLLVHLLLLVTQVMAFSWHGAYKSAPSSPSGVYSGWQPETFWWRNRRRNSNAGSKPAPSVGVWFGQKARRHHPREPRVGERFVDLDNHIANMAQPAFAAPRLERERVGWGFLRPLHHPGVRSSSARQQSPSPQYVSFHYSTPAFGSLGIINRRNKLNIVREKLDQEVMKNAIKEVLDEEPRHGGAGSPAESVQAPSPAAGTPPAEEFHEATTATPPALGAPASHHHQHHHHGPVEHPTLPRQNVRSSSEGSSGPMFSGFGPAYPAAAAGQGSFSEFPSLGFGSIVEQPDLPGGFGQPVMTEIQPQAPYQLQTSGGFGAGDFSGVGFGGGGGGAGKVDTAVGQFGWREPLGFGDVQGGSPSAGIHPIPTAVAAAPMGSFSQDDRDCDTILTKSCTGDSDCVCYGFYFCSPEGKCKDITSSSSDTAAMTFGDQWHDGPAEKLGLTGRR